MATMKTAAENATPGEWCCDDRHGVIADTGLNGNFYIASCSGPEHRPNARFIALANPANILALVEALEKAQNRERQWKEAAERRGKRLTRQALEILQQENRISELEGDLAAEEERRGNWFRMAEELGGKLDAAEERIRELDKRLIEYAGIATREARRVAELEARTVKLPKPIIVLHRRDFTDAYRAIYAYPEAEVNAALAAAGIGVKGE
ncbi:hypothetical protein PJ96_001415 [Salmonella enterica subsp. enterica]|nr:hypothetical protein [Salmonella enterica subsp. enterica]